MRVLKVFNNNVALVRDEKGREIVAQGRGIAFQARPGDRLDPAAVERRFVPEPSATPEQFAQLVASIPSEIIAIAEEILGLGSSFGLDLDQRAVVALADHLALALERGRAGQSFDNPLEWEVRLLYVREAGLGAAALDLVERRTGVRLPPVEAIPLALHFVNAQVGAGRLSEAVRTARLIRDILAMIEEDYGITLSGSDTLAPARFATHLRYLFIGHMTGERTLPLIAEVARSIREGETRAYACAQRISAYLTREMGWNIDDDEAIYIALHIQRMTRRASGGPTEPA